MNQSQLSPLPAIGFIAVVMSIAALCVFVVSIP